MATTETTREAREAAVRMRYGEPADNALDAYREWIENGDDAWLDDSERQLAAMARTMRAILASHAAAAVERAHNEGRAMGRADVGKYANAIGRIESAVGIVGAVPLGETVAAVEKFAAAVERERERCVKACMKRRGEYLRLAETASAPTRREWQIAAGAAKDCAERIDTLLRSRPPRAGAEATNATREARPRCTTCGDSGWSIDDESNRRRCSCAAAGRGEVGRG